MSNDNLSASSVLNDSELADWLSRHAEENQCLAFSNALHLFKVFKVTDKQTDLVAGDLGAKSFDLLKDLARNRKLKRVAIPFQELSESQFSDPDWELVKVLVKDIKEIYRHRENKIFGTGRGKKISSKTQDKVWYESGGRCMYKGCGIDLGSTPLTNKNARIGYLAHIVASDPDGPRGNEMSHSLSDDPDNIMLMCDAHHRLIDRIDVFGNTSEKLREMRRLHVDKVKSLLNSLSYPNTRIITILSNIGQISTDVYQPDLIECAISRKLSPLPEIKHMIRRTQRDDRSRLNFWTSTLYEHENDIRELMSFIKTSSSKFDCDTLSIFPLHLIPFLILSGRIIGEARPVEIYQYDRSRKTWQWPAIQPSNQGTLALAFDENRINNYEEALLTIELTAELSTDKLPDNLRQSINENKMIWAKIKNSRPDANCIYSQDRLDEFTLLARESIKKLQDEYNVKKIHLVSISPASTLFRFGQLLQPGHHSTYTIYDRADGKSSFIPALSIDGSSVYSEDLSIPENHKISLR